MAAGITTATLRVSPHARWTVIDQGISSASNLLLVITVARSSDVQEFGAFSLAYMTYGLLLGAGRAAGGDILLLRAEQQRGHVEQDSRRLLGVALAVGVVGSLMVCSIAAWSGGTLAGSLFVVGSVLPILLAQDALRYCLIARRTAAWAAASDLIWLSVQVLALGALLLGMPNAGPVPAVLAWACGAAASLAAGLWRARLTPTFSGLSSWFTQDPVRVSSFFGDFAMMTGSGYAAVYLIAVVGTIEDVAAVRGAVWLFAPLDALFLGVRLVSLSALARSTALGGSGLQSQAGLVAVLSLVITVVWAAAALSLPQSIGQAVLGATWQVVTPLILPIALASAGKYMALPPQAGLRALGATRWIVGLRTTVTCVLFAGVIIGTPAAGAFGAAAGLAVAFGIEGALSWWGFLRSCRVLAASTAEARRRSESPTS